MLFGLPSAVAAGTVLGAMFWITIRRPGLGMIFFLFFFAFAWRMRSVLFIDLFGPVFSEQLDRDIGPGMSAVPLAISQGFVIAALLFSFRQRRLQSFSLTAIRGWEIVCLAEGSIYRTFAFWR